MDNLILVSIEKSNNYDILQLLSTELHNSKASKKTGNSYEILESKLPDLKEKGLYLEAYKGIKVDPRGTPTEKSRKAFKIAESNHSDSEKVNLIKSILKELQDLTEEEFEALKKEKILEF